MIIEIELKISQDYKLRPNGSDNTILSKHFKQYRNELNQLIQTSKIEYFERKINQNMNNPNGLRKSGKTINGKHLHNKLKSITTKKSYNLTHKNLNASLGLDNLKPMSLSSSDVIINKYIDILTFSGWLKNASIKALCKTGNKRYVINYRPVSQ